MGHTGYKKMPGKQQCHSDRGLTGVFVYRLKDFIQGVFVLSTA